MGAGACLALGAGHGVAAADTDSSDDSGSTSRSTDNDSSATSESSPRNPDSDTKSDESSDPASVPSSVKQTDADLTDADESEPSTSRTRHNRVFTLDRDVADDSRVRTLTEASDEDAPDTAVDGSEGQDESAITTADSSADASTPVVTESEVVAPEVASPTATPLTGVVTETPVKTTATIQTEAKAATKPRSPGPVATVVLNVMSALGWSARPEAVAAFPALAPWAATTPAASEATTSAQAAAIAVGSSTVTGVQTGRAQLTIPIGTNGYTTRADWYLPTQADGSVSATGVIWLQHGFLNDKSFLSALAKTLSQQTNSIVVAPNLPSFPSLRCSGCWINGVPMQQAVATMFLGDRESLNASALAAGYQGVVLPENFILSGQSAGGGFAANVGGYYAIDPLNTDSLRGVVMFDGVAFSGAMTASLERLDTLQIPVYQVAAPPQAFNSNGATTKELVAGRPGQFVGATLAGGSHADAILGSSPLIDFFAQLVTSFSPPGNTAATYTLSTGWINDLYQGLGPADGTGIYGAPDQYIVMGDTAAVVLGPPPVVDIAEYLGTWYEVGSVKQFFSIGLVNTKAVYSPNPDGSIKVVNSGNYFFNNGPKSSITGSALPVNAENNRLNVTFFGPASDRPPGNYWIVDLDPDYQWAIVSDSTGLSGFLLTRSPTVSDDFYQELLDRASVKGVRGWITRTRQPAAEQSTISV